MTRMTTLKTTLRGLALGALGGLTLGLGPAAPAQAQAEPFIGELMNFGGNFCPRGWARADGTLLPIASNDALFSLYGTIYGGDGRSTFGLPDLRGRVAVGAGNGAGLTPLQVGQRGGTEEVTLTVSQIPPHNHSLRTMQGAGTLDDPTSAYFAGSTSLPYHDGPSDGSMDPGMIANSGSGQPFYVTPPYETTMWCVALEGIYPSRS